MRERDVTGPDSEQATILDAVGTWQGQARAEPTKVVLLLVRSSGTWCGRWGFRFIYLFGERQALAAVTKPEDVPMVTPRPAGGGRGIGRR